MFIVADLISLKRSVPESHELTQLYTVIITKLALVIRNMRVLNSSPFFILLTCSIPEVSMYMYFDSG